MSQTWTFGYSFDDSSQCAGGACSVNTQELTRQQDVHNVWDRSYKSLIGVQWKGRSGKPSELFAVWQLIRSPKTVAFRRQIFFSFKRFRNTVVISAAFCRSVGEMKKTLQIRGLWGEAGFLLNMQLKCKNTSMCRIQSNMKEVSLCQT